VWEISEKSRFKEETMQFATSSREAWEKSNLQKVTCEAHD